MGRVHFNKPLTVFIPVIVVRVVGREYSATRGRELTTASYQIEREIYITRGKCYKIHTLNHITVTKEMLLLLKLPYSWEGMNG